MPEKTCLCCGELLLGRMDKKFCDDHCRSSYNNLQYVGLNQTLRKINLFLKRNRRILGQFIFAENPQETVVSNRKLQELGFQFQYHTHISITREGETCFCCYDIGIIPKGEEIKVIKWEEQN